MQQVQALDHAQDVKSGGIFISLRVKLLVGFTLIFGLVFAGAFYWFYTFAEDVAEQRLTQSLHNALAGAAAQINGDEMVALANEAEANEAGLTDDPRYWELAEQLYYIHQIDPLAWPYTYIPGDEEKEVIYVVSSAAMEEPFWGVPFLSSEITESTRMQQGLERPSTFLDDPYDWQETKWVSGFAPIYSPTTGEVVGGLGIDYDFKDVLAVRSQVLALALPAFVIIFAVLFVLVYLVSNWFARPIQRLTAVAERIGEGDYNVDLSSMSQSRVPDEITTLAKVFDGMTHKVEKREETLKQRVAELEIKLDVEKRDQQVSEIVDSDFFTELQTKAREMRERKARSGSLLEPIENGD